MINTLYKLLGLEINRIDSIAIDTQLNTINIFLVKPLDAKTEQSIYTNFKNFKITFIKG